MSNVHNHYSELSKCIQKQNSDKIISLTNKLLRSYEGNFKVFQCKIVALINLDRFEDALETFSKYPQYQNYAVFEKAYCLYRLNKEEEALKTIECSPEKNTLQFQELKAQILYRREHFEECYDLYKNLIKQTADEFDEERKTNLTAALANLASQGRIIDLSSFIPGKNSTETYEMLFNAACYLMVLNKYKEAESYLSASEEVCRKYSDEDITQEMEQELMVIKTQIACCKHLNNNEKYALNVYNEVLESKPTDYGVIAVTINNILSIDKLVNIFDLKKKIKVLQSDAVMSKLSNFQRKIVTMNVHQISAFSALSANEGLNMCDALLTEHSEKLDKIVLLKAGVLVKHGNMDEAVYLIEDYLKKSCEARLDMKLALTQLHLNMGNYDGACQVLRSLGDDLFRPGVVSALVTIMTTLGDSAGAACLLESAVKWNKQNQKNNTDLLALSEHLADLHLRRGHPELALSVLEELLNTQPDNTRVLAKLILAYAKLNSSKALQYFEKIQILFNLVPKLDINLENHRWMSTFKSTKGDPNVQSPRKSFLYKKRSNKKKKKLPKNYDPQMPVDPERWLPKEERSYYRKKKDRRNKDIGKGSQGASSSYVDLFDITKTRKQGKTKDLQSQPLEEHKIIPSRKRNQRKKKGKRCT